MQAEAEGSLRIASIVNGGKGPNAYSYSDDRGHLFLKVWLLDASINKNFWGVTPDSIPRNIPTAIGKPLVLYKNSGHEPDSNRRTVGEYDHPYLAGSDSLSHALAYQDLFRVGTFIDVFESDIRKGEWWGVAEVTDPDTVRGIREDPNVPMYVSPMIHLLDPTEPEDSHSKWSFIHSAIVGRPAYGTAKAYVSGECSGGKETCMLQLRRAAISAHEGQAEGSCGFCRYKAIKEIQVNLRQASVSYSNSSYDTSLSSLDKNKAHFKTRNLSDNNQDNKGNDNQSNNNQKDQNQEQTNNKDQQPQNQEQQEQQSTQSKTSTTTRTQVNEKTGAPTQIQEVDMSTDKTTEQVDEETRKRAKNKQASSSDMLEAIERLSVENQNLKLKLQTAQSDNQTLRSVNDQFNTRLASLEQDRAQERAAVRKQQIESYVESAPAYKLLSAQARQQQVQNFVSGSMEIEEIKRIVEPLNESVAKTYGVSNRAASFRPQKLQLGTNERVIEVRSASENKPSNNTVVSDNNGEDSGVPHWLSLSQQYRAGKQSGGIQ